MSALVFPRLGRRASLAPKIRTYEENFALLQVYKEEHGDCDVPVDYEPDPALAKWVQWLRYGKVSISSERYAALMKLGFSWSNQKSKHQLISSKQKHERAWTDTFHRLKQYKSKYGRCDVDPDYQADPELAQWVLVQRSLHAQGTLRRDRELRLEHMGFVWDGPTVATMSTSNSEASLLPEDEENAPPTQEPREEKKPEEHSSPSSSEGVSSSSAVQECTLKPEEITRRGSGPLKMRMKRAAAAAFAEERNKSPGPEETTQPQVKLAASGLSLSGISMKPTTSIPLRKPLAAAKKTATRKPASPSTKPTPIPSATSPGVVQESDHAQEGRQKRHRLTNSNETSPTLPVVQTSPVAVMGNPFLPAAATNPMQHQAQLAKLTALAEASSLAYAGLQQPSLFAVNATANVQERLWTEMTLRRMAMQHQTAILAQLQQQAASISDPAASIRPDGNSL